MERISELLDAITMSAEHRGTSNKPVVRWAAEATNRIQELGYRIEELERYTGLNKHRTMNYEDTPQNRVTNLVMEYALKYSITYDEALVVFRDALR